MGHLMSTQVPFVLHRLVAFVAANISSYRMHVQDMLEKKSFAFFFFKNFIGALTLYYLNYLLQIELIGKVSVTVDAKLGLTRFPSLALVASRRQRKGFWLF